MARLYSRGCNISCKARQVHQSRSCEGNIQLPSVAKEGLGQRPGRRRGPREQHCLWPSVSEPGFSAGAQPGMNQHLLVLLRVRIWPPLTAPSAELTGRATAPAGEWDAPDSPLEELPHSRESWAHLVVDAAASLGTADTPAGSLDRPGLSSHVKTHHSSRSPIWMHPGTSPRCMCPSCEVGQSGCALSPPSWPPLG